MATTDGRVDVTFSTVPIQIPAILEYLVRDHLDERGLANGWQNTNWPLPRRPARPPPAAR